MSRLHLSRRVFLQAGVAAASAAWWNAPAVVRGAEPVAGERPQREAGIVAENPRLRIPMSLIIDDSTCLVNLAHFAIPQFAQVFPQNYRQDWKTLPREIPDSFVRKFGEWCHEQGVKGKYSIVPYPACVGWVDREMPGWSRAELDASLDLVRTLMLPDWDIHPEMVSHTWVIDTKTGRPFAEKSERTMENWRWTDGKSVDELTDYLAFALRILKNAGLPCEGITTPGGFGNRVLGELSQASLQSVRDVYNAEIPHYFRHLFTDGRSVAPRVESARGLATDHPECVVSIIGCTGDWFGGWDGLEIGRTNQFITEDGKGRLPEVIARGEPAVLVCHWPGIYCNGNEDGFRIFQETVQRLHARYDHLLWMKLSEISRYWAARELTDWRWNASGVVLTAPFAAPDFTLRLQNVRMAGEKVFVRTARGVQTSLEPGTAKSLRSGQYVIDGTDVVVCFPLEKGANEISGLVRMI